MSEDVAQAERQRIARELHDVISQSISGVAVQTQAVRRRLGPGHEREAADLRAVEGTVREAMTELRRLFGVLRTAGDGAPLAPQPGLAQLPGLLEEARAGGLAVDYEEVGEPRPVSLGLGLTAYRIVREALMNARGGAAAVRVEHSADALCVEVGGGGYRVRARLPRSEEAP